MAVPEMALRRLKGDYTQLLTEPIENIWGHPLENNILVWHYVFRGPAETPFEGGFYHGKLVFPQEYPLRPPAILMLTPNGKFVVNQRLCVSGICDLHPERWSPAQTVSSILISFYSFMIDDKCGPFRGMATEGFLSYTPTVREMTRIKQKELAKQSWSFNLNDKTFCKYFPELAEQSKQLNAHNV